jgi:hypothetical protein
VGEEGESNPGAPPGMFVWAAALKENTERMATDKITFIIDTS